jgi:hypothetical protein
MQVVASTPMYTMEVNNFSWRIKKFSGKQGTISLREFKATFSIMVCELELKYDVNYTEAFCCNFNLGLATKARACKGVGQE